PNRFAELMASGQAIVSTCHVCLSSENSPKPLSADVLAFAPLTTVSWGVIIRQSENEALLPSRQLVLRLVLLGSVLVVCTLSLVLILMQNIVKPVRILTNAANRLALNDYNVLIPKGRNDEIGQLSVAFQSMREELQKSRREIYSRYEKARQRGELRGQLLNSVIDAQEQERRRIARELHDEYGQTLTGLLMTVESVENSLPPEATYLRERLANTRNVVSRAIQGMRQLIMDLRPPSLEELGLVTAVKTYVHRQFNDGIEPIINIRGITGRLPSLLEVTIFRIIQESVHNIVKHARAKNVIINLSLQDKKILLTVEDDGRGFDIDTLLSGVSGIRTWGILGIRERTELIGGKFNIKSEKGKGTRIEIELPIDQPSVDIQQSYG
ncbi:MAG: histidine kinase, partial [Nitrospira sp.]|nr:histidine kinase [Nitrospira sp.]